ncbi:hypothetical protein TNCV_4168471 [Trichonephila clavipes]|nr:hypothetical protein TNCV_4168471 [Trichonephila clavipes]
MSSVLLPTRQQLRTIPVAVGSLVVKASDSRPEALGSMPDAPKYPPSTHGVEIGGVAICHKEVQPISQAMATFIPSLREFHELNRTVTCMRLKAKANDRRTSCPLPR